MFQVEAFSTRFSKWPTKLATRPIKNQRTNWYTLFCGHSSTVLRQAYHVFQRRRVGRKRVLCQGWVQYRYPTWGVFALFLFSQGWQTVWGVWGRWWGHWQGRQDGWCWKRRGEFSWGGFLGWLTWGRWVYGRRLNKWERTYDGEEVDKIIFGEEVFELHFKVNNDIIEINLDY